MPYKCMVIGDLLQQEFSSSCNPPFFKKELRPLSRDIGADHFIGVTYVVGVNIRGCLSNFLPRKSLGVCSLKRGRNLFSLASLLAGEA